MLDAGGALALGAGMLAALKPCGFALLPALFGLVVAPVASSVQRYLPWFSLAVGLDLAGLTRSRAATAADTR